MDSDRRPRSLRGLWAGHFPEDLDIDAVLYLYFADSLMPRGVFRVLFPAYFLAAGVYLLFAEPELATTWGMKSFKILSRASWR